MLHTGDFRMDQLPSDGRLTDLGGFARLGAEGVDLLMSDSTNAEVPGFVTSEREIAPVIDEVIRTAEQAGHRGQLRLARPPRPAGHGRGGRKHGRKVALVGRSMVRNMGVARDLGYLQGPAGPDRRLAGRSRTGRRRTWCSICTGSQGEPMAALSRMANRDHPIRIAEGDTVLLASSLVPGNETAVNKVINGLTRWGARVVHKGNAKVHVSGHAAAGELLYVLNLTRPSNFMPVHGEWRHLRAHAKLAALTGVPDDHIVIAEDGVVVDLVDGRAKIVGAVPAGYVYVDGSSVGDDHRLRAEGPPHPRRRGLHLRRHRGRLHHRQARRRPGDPRPWLRHRPGAVRRGPCRRSRGRCRRTRPTGWSTSSRSAGWSAAPSGAG